MPKQKTIIHELQSTDTYAKFYTKDAYFDSKIKHFTDNKDK